MRRAWRLVAAELGDRALEVGGPKSKQSAASGQDALEDGASLRRDIGRELVHAFDCVGGGEVDLGLALEALRCVGAGNGEQQPSHDGHDKRGRGKIDQSML